MANKRAGTLYAVAEYYSEKLSRFGETPQGVDWNGETGQQLRFRQLCKIVTPGERFSINDIGCGYGALIEYLSAHHKEFSYLGCDISSSMIEAARRRYSGPSTIRFVESDTPNEVADYSVASGIFNVRLEHSIADWEEYIRQTLQVMNASSRRGFAFNCLTSYSDAEKMQEKLYYADPAVWFDLCKRIYSRNVALLHDYDLYEFTILVRKEV